MRPGEGEVVQSFYPLQRLLLKGSIKELSPVVCQHDDFFILCADKLSVVDYSRLLDNSGNVVKACNFGATENLFKQSEAPVGIKFCVPHY